MRILLALTALLLLAAGPPLEASGRVTLDTEALEIKSGFATWNPADHRLRLMLLPFVPSSEQMSWVEKFPEADYQVVESPARPFVRLDLELTENAAGGLRAEQVKFWNLSLWRIGSSNGSASHSAQKLLGSLTVSGDFRNGQPIRFEGQGEHSSGMNGQVIKWRFNGYCRVLVVPTKAK